MVFTDNNAVNLLNTASFLNSKLSLGRDTSINSRTLLKKNKLAGQNIILQDIKDATETYNREFIERENELKINPDKPLLSTTQDWTLFMLFGSYALFSLGILIYIFRFSKRSFLLGTIFMFLTVIVYTFLVFLIQRYG